jgi:hypothetical protein
MNEVKPIIFTAYNKLIRDILLALIVKMRNSYLFLLRFEPYTEQNLNFFIIHILFIKFYFKILHYKMC